MCGRGAEPRPFRFGELPLRLGRRPQEHRPRRHDRARADQGKAASHNEPQRRAGVGSERPPVEITGIDDPVVREELRTALSAGHGVFRNFKDILRSHPEIERLWYSFKDREMRNIVLEWYNSLRDFWGLERIGSEPEETEEIVSHDFSFREADQNDEVAVDVLLTSIEDEIAESLAPGLSDAIEELSARISDPDDGAGECVIVADSPEAHGELRPGGPPLALANPGSQWLRVVGHGNRAVEEAEPGTPVARP